MVNPLIIRFTGWQFFSTVGIFALVLGGLMVWNDHQPDYRKLPAGLVLATAATTTAVLTVAGYVLTS